MNAPDRLPLKPDPQQTRRFVDGVWDEQIVPALTDYIRVPAKSPAFDADWAEHAHLDAVVREAAAWVERQHVAGLQLEVIRLSDAAGRPRTPLIFFDIPATRPAPATGEAPTVLMYGHLDKQPEFTGWRSDLGPWEPKLIDGRLYGRGGADDGYAVYAALTAVQALDAASQAHYGAPLGFIGQGGTIPLMNQLQAGFPQAQMVVCGVLGPKSNAHGPNEFLHVPYGKRLTAAVADVIAAMP